MAIHAVRFPIFQLRASRVTRILCAVGPVPPQTAASLLEIMATLVRCGCSTRSAVYLCIEHAGVKRASDACLHVRRLVMVLVLLCEPHLFFYFAVPFRSEKRGRGASRIVCRVSRCRVLRFVPVRARWPCVFVRATSFPFLCVVVLPQRGVALYLTRDIVFVQ